MDSQYNNLAIYSFVIDYQYTFFNIFQFYCESNYLSK